MAGSNQQIISNILNAAQGAAEMSTNEESLANVVQSTRNLFRPRGPRRESVTNNRRKSTFKKKVFLIKLSNSDFFPARCEQLYLKKRGLGYAKDWLTISRTWDMEKIKSEIGNLYNSNIKSLLHMCDFDFGKLEKNKKLAKLHNLRNGSDLEEQGGQGIIVIIPKRDFPNDLPVELELVNEATTVLPPPSVPMATSVTRSGSTSLLGNTLTPMNLSPPQYDLTYMDIEESASEIIFESSESSLDIEFCCLSEDAPRYFIEINRQEDIVQNIIRLYEVNEDLVTNHLCVSFTNELGIDGGGLTRELFTIFWRTLLSNPYYFKGHDVSLPYLPLHLMRKKKSDFKVFGRILSHSVLLTQSLPSKLPVFVYLIFGGKGLEKYIKENIINEYLLYLTPSERYLVSRALNNFSILSSKEIDRLTSLFSSNNFNDIPDKNEFSDQISLIAEKVLIKDTLELMTEIKNGLSVEVLIFFENLPESQLFKLYNRTKPNRKKVMECLTLESPYSTNEQEKTFFFLQNYVENLHEKDLERFLLFVTGSVNMPEKINVGFHEYRGIDRRPIAHTCTCELKLATNFGTQQEFDYELAIFLNDDTSFEYSSV